MQYNQLINIKEYETMDGLIFTWINFFNLVHLIVTEYDMNDERNTEIQNWNSTDHINKYDNCICVALIRHIYFNICHEYTIETCVVIWAVNCWKSISTYHMW